MESFAGDGIAGRGEGAWNKGVLKGEAGPHTGHCGEKTGEEGRCLTGGRNRVQNRLEEGRFPPGDELGCR